MLPIHGKGGIDLQNPPKMVKIPSKRHVFGFQMMGFFLQNDLGIMKNVLSWCQGVVTLSKVHATLSKVHTNLTKCMRHLVRCI
jgi:hypothetical protein